MLPYGFQVTEGSGAVLVIAVGENSEWGKTMALVRSESADTPLQDSLGSLAAAIGKLGLAVGVLCFIVLTVRYAPPISWLQVCTHVLHLSVRCGAPSPGYKYVVLCFVVLAVRYCPIYLLQLPQPDCLG